jgi:hypothetical protein
MCRDGLSLIVQAREIVPKKEMLGISAPLWGNKLMTNTKKANYCKVDFG